MSTVIGPKYPDIEVELTSEDGNAFSIIGRVQREMRDGGISAEEIKKFQIEATSGNYTHLLQTVMKWVSTN